MAMLHPKMDRGLFFFCKFFLASLVLKKVAKSNLLLNVISSIKKILFRNTKIICVLNLLLIFGREASWDNLPKEFTQIYNQVTAICQFHNGVELFREQHFKLSISMNK